MTNQQLKQLKAMFRKFNENNKKHGRKYVISVEKFDYNSYAMKVKFDLLFSTDNYYLMKWFLENSVFCFIHNKNGESYLDIQ